MMPFGITNCTLMFSFGDPVPGPVALSTTSIALAAV